MGRCAHAFHVQQSHTKDKHTRTLTHTRAHAETHAHTHIKRLQIEPSGKKCDCKAVYVITLELWGTLVVAPDL